MIFKPHRLGATQHAGEEGSDRSQQAAAERLPDDQQRDESSSHLFHQPGHEVVSVVYEDAAPSSHQQEHAVGVSHTGEDGLHALHAGPGAFRHARVVQQQGGVDDWDESSFGDMCRRLVAVTEVLQVADAASWASALCHFSLDRFLLVLLRLSSHFCKGVKYRHFCSAGDGLPPELLITLQSGSACCIPHFCTLSSFLLPAQCRSHFTLTIFGCLHMTPRTRQKANWHDQVFCHVALLPATWLPRWSGTCKHARP